MSKVVAFLSYGQGGGVVDSLLSFNGTGRLNDKIKALGVDAPGPFSWLEASAIATRIKSLPAGTKVIVGGTSLGGNAAPHIGELVAPRSIDLMFGIQPSLYGEKVLLPSNVKRAMCFSSPWWWPVTFGLGQYQWLRAAQNHSTTLLSYQTFLPHPGDNAESVHGPILAEIRKLL